MIVNAAINDLIRPALYSAHHEIPALRHGDHRPLRADVVGPAGVLPRRLAICTAGAHGFSQSSNYSARPRAAEVLVESDDWRVIRTRETFEDLIRGEE